MPEHLKPTWCALYESRRKLHWTWIKSTWTNFRRLNTVILEIEPNVMKKFKQKYPIQIRLIRNYKIQIHQKLQIRRI